MGNNSRRMEEEMRRRVWRRWGFGVEDESGLGEGRRREPGPGPGGGGGEGREIGRDQARWRRMEEISSGGRRDQMVGSGSEDEVVWLEVVEVSG